jgi:hypothetical protein
MLNARSKVWYRPDKVPWSIKTLAHAGDDLHDVVDMMDELIVVV